MKKTALSLVLSAALLTGAAAPAANAAIIIPPDNGFAAPYEIHNTTHTVVAGESLSSIAKRYNVSGGYLLLAQINNISSPYTIKVGQKLVVPLPYYIVQPGEGWYAVARNTGVPLNALFAENNASLNTPLSPYQLLNLPLN